MTAKGITISVYDGDNNLTVSRDIDVSWPGYESISTVQLLDELYETARVSLLDLTKTKEEW